MAINTPKPISRDERYLSKIGGNEEVIVPKPISREEKYMYRAAGYDDQPIPDYPIGRNEKYWAKIVENSGGSENGSTVTFDSGQKFISDNSSLKDYKIYGNGGEIHSTGVLPLTFTAKGGNAADWVIEGNDENGTENLFDADDYFVKAYVKSNVTFTKSGNDLKITATDTNDPYVNGSVGNGSSLNEVFRNGLMPVQAGDTLTFSCTTSAPIYHFISFVDSNYNGIADLIKSNESTNTFTIPQNCKYILIRFANSQMTANQEYTISNIMLVKGSTAPDHYIPYQQGVGERTANLFDCRKNSQGYTDTTVAGVRFLYGNQSITLSQTANGRYPQQQISGEDGILTLIKNTQYYGKLYIDNAPENANIYMLLQASTDGSSYTTITTIRSAGVTFTPNDDYTVYRWLFVAEGEGFTYNNTVVKFAIVEGSTAPDHYIPYGYQIPISISHNMLGTAKVGTYESTGYSPSATGSLTTEPIYLDAGTYIYHTPNMAFSFASRKYIVDDASVSGSVFTNAQPDKDYTFTISTSGFYTFQINKQSGVVTQEDLELYDATAKLTQPQDYTFYIGDSPLTAGQSISKTSTGQDIELFEGENTVSTTLYNKPPMEIETSYGVGVKDNNHYIIPFKVNTTIYNIQIGDSPLYDGEYLSYKEKKLYKYIDSVLTPIDPPSPFPEISTTEGVNKVIIETSTQPDSIFITTQNPIKLVQPNIGTKTIIQDGVYNASDDNLDGYSSVTVNTN